MRPFTYERAGRRGSRRWPRPASRARKFIAGGTNLLDLMKLEIETPPHLVDISRLPLARDRRAPTAACGSARMVTQHRPRRRSARARALSGAVARAAGRRLGAAAQQGDHRRQPAAAHALLLLLRHRPSPATSASPAPAARRCRASTASTPSSAPATPASPCIRPTWRSRCAALDAAGRGAVGPTAGARIPIADFHRLPGDTPQHRDRRSPRRADHRRDAAAAAGRRAGLSQGARPRVLCLRAGVGGRRRRASRAIASARRASRSAAWRTSRGARRGRARAAPAAGLSDDAFAAAGRGGADGRAAATATTTSRSPLAAAHASRATLIEAAAQRKA